VIFLLQYLNLLLHVEMELVIQVKLVQAVQVIVDLVAGMDHVIMERHAQVVQVIVEPEEIVEMEI
jgi:hypothetical protein